MPATELASQLDLQALCQQLAALAAVAVAAAWLTARWLARRRGECGGACSRCTHACARAEGAVSRAAGDAPPDPPRGVRPAGLRVVQAGSGASGPQSPFAGDPRLDENLSAPRDV
jgi:hypothetical protein